MPEGYRCRNDSLVCDIPRLFCCISSKKCRVCLTLRDTPSFPALADTFGVAVLGLQARSVLQVVAMSGLVVAVWALFGCDLFRVVAEIRRDVAASLRRLFLSGPACRVWVKFATNKAAV